MSWRLGKVLRWERRALARHSFWCGRGRPRSQDRWWRLMGAWSGSAGGRI